ncbi:MAG: HAMP domain-containing sensor histidine kinase [Paeniclostridium sordellii]|uniref:sensor histidine kinase n=1 Tax=Paeniclostridium hominis TaxID=2764329 RepID=UPI001A9AB0BA|nr:MULTISPECIES: HAMP domain-containing sensor histidine kinase [Paeniclostridium]MDU1539590.1 HAMP domain-containing sensor histidine kinase [Paeniclostridium sordellii]MDU2592576.1 HAMP domain-containing sensor histidine kinase [Paeniclostridium sordellii]
MKSNYFEKYILKSSPIPYIFGELKKSSNSCYSFKIEKISDTFEVLFDIEKNDIIGKELNEVFILDNSNEILESIFEQKNTRAHIKNFKQNYEFVSKNIEGNKYVIWLIDIKKELEFENSNKIRSEFFANLSHELRTPLNLIFSSLQVLDLKVESSGIKEEESISKYLNMATQNTYRLLKLVNNIIDSNKITSGYFDYNPQNYDIINFVEGICQSIVDFAKYKNIEIIFDTDIEEKIISFDLDKMERIILNILSNAIKFSKDNGSIKIYTREIEDMIEIEISDDGIGIPPHKLSSIFDRFKQVDNNIIRRGEGSGIGLYLVKSLVDMHGGNIEVDSEIDKGTIFKIQIPNKTVIDSECIIAEKNLQNSYIEKIKVEFSDIYA